MRSGGPVVGALPGPVRHAAEQARPVVVSSVNAVRRRLPGLARVRGEVAQLGSRVSALEHALQHDRRLNRELAEVVDIVQQVVIPSVLGEREDLDALVDKYAAFI